MPRAIWSGSISFGLVNIPVKLYSAVSRKTVHFNQTRRPHRQARIKQKRVSAEDGAEVPYEQIVKGYELSSGAYVIISDDELAALDPKALRTIDIDEFVDLADIDPIFYDSAYYLAPDKAAKPYALLAQAMEEQGKVGIAHFVMRTKQYLAAIRPVDGELVLSTMVYADEVNDPAAIPELADLDDVELPDKELDDGPPAHRVAVGRLRARQVPGHLPRGGARPHRAQGGRRGRDRAGRRRPSRTRSSTSWPRSRRRWRRPRTPGRASHGPRGRRDDEARPRRRRRRPRAGPRRRHEEGPPRRRRPRRSRRRRPRPPASPPWRLDRAPHGARRTTVVEIDGRQLKLSNLDKVLYPEAGFTKGEVIDYYAADRAGDAPPPRRPVRHLAALPERRRRQVVLREALPVAPARLGRGRHRARVTAAARSTTACFDERAAVVWAANLAALELHTPMARAADIETPTMVVFDLDPGDGRR